MTYLPGLFGPAIATAEALPPFRAEGLLPLEAAAMDNAVPRRRAEFATGRVLARQAMAQLGHAPRAIPPAPDRSPLWPPGLVGSISHSDGLCGVALARRADGVLMLGLDIEPAQPLAADLWETVLTPAERTRLSSHPDAEPGLLARIAFSAKECAYKAQYPITGILFGFDMFAVETNIAAGRFRATWQGSAGPFTAGLAWQGRLRVAGGHIITALCLTEPG